MSAKELIESGKTALGIELGSTRIKGVLTDFDGNVLAVGFHDWQNSFINGVWTYGLNEIHAGLRGCYGSLRAEVERRYGVTPVSFGAIGISAMMHGYMALDERGEQLAPFQTWRNTNTQQAADELTGLLDFNIPLRWSAAHLYQRILDNEPHIKKLDTVCTLAAYIHRRLTGERVTGVGDAAGMFPIDSETHDYDANMVEKFDTLTASHGFKRGLCELFPKVLTAGEDAGYLTEEGARLLDDTGSLLPGILFCPPEGDAGTGMVATNAVAPYTGNISAGTSTFAMLVLKDPLLHIHREIDMVTTPSGFPCAMSHANNGTSDLNAWIGIFEEFSRLMGVEADEGALFEKLYTHSLKGDADCGGLLAYGYYSGENVTFINEGRPAFLRTPNSRFTLANFMRVNLYTSLGAVKIGLDILMKDEKVKVERITGHGGLFKTKGVAQRYLSAAMDIPVTVMDTASEGGAWGIAVLAAYAADRSQGESLEDFLTCRIFSGQEGVTIKAERQEAAGFEKFMERYKKGLDIERAAIAVMDWE